MPQLCGGTGSTKEATPEVQKFCDELRSAVEEKIGKSFDAFEAKVFKSQVVAGVNYFVKV
jgi:cystatin-A/B